MKTYDKIKTLTYNDYSFFKGISTSNAKWEFAYLLYKEFDKIPLTKAGNPIISQKDKLDKSLFDFTMRSNSILEGKNQMEYLCNYYNNGIPIQKLKQYSENEPMRKAMRFTGKNQIINDILNPEQLIKIQKTWVLRNAYLKRKFSKKTMSFIHKNEWSINHLIKNGIDQDLIDKQLASFRTDLSLKKNKT